MKSLLSAFLIVIMIGGFALAGTMRFSTVQASTGVTGVIDSDTTWTKANSPYTLTGNVLVSNGVTLTVEPGVTVNLYGYYIMINGTLSARGNNDDQIHINSINGEIKFTQSSNGWNEQTGSGCIIENAIMSDVPKIHISNVSPKISYSSVAAQIIIDGGSPIISNNNIIKSGFAHGDEWIISQFSINSGSPIISNNTFDEVSINIDGGSPIISNNIFIGYTYRTQTGSLTRAAGGIEATGGEPYIFGNTISNCSTGILAVAGTIERNYIFNNTFGIEIGNGIILNNTITNNVVGISVKSNSSPTIIYNNVDSIRLSSSNNVDATHNWWGTTDTAEIDQKIWDFNDDFNLGKVNYTPFLTEPNPEAMPDPNAPTPTHTPTPPPATSPSTSPTPSQEPGQTELTTIVGAVIVVVVLGTGLGLLIYLIKRK